MNRTARLALAVILTLICPAFCAARGLFDHVIPMPQQVEFGEGTVAVPAPGRALLVLADEERQSPAAPQVTAYLHELGFDPVDLATLGHLDTNYDLVVIVGPMADNPAAAPYAEYFADLEAELPGLPRPREASILAVRSINGKPVIWLGGARPAGSYYAWITLRQILRPGPGPFELPELTVRDWPDFEFRGVLEGGMRSWAHPYRVEIMEFMGPMKFNFFLYCPKGDAKTRRRWREEYTVQEVEQLREVFAAAARGFVEVGYALNLALSCRFADPDEFDRIIRRFRRMHEAGALHFGLFFDDALPNLTNDADREAYGRLGIAQADLANRVYAEVKQWNPEMRFFFTPNLYWGWDDVVYLRDLRENLDPDIQVGWTGEFIASREITDEHAQKIEAVLGRKAGVGDNFWTTGFTPLIRRSPTLYKHVTGYITNAEWVSRICLDTTGDYTWNAEGYDPDRSFDNALAKVAGAPRVKHLRAFIEAFEGRNRLDPRTMGGPVAAAMNDLVTAAGDGVLAAAVALWDELNLALEALEIFNEEVIRNDMKLTGQGGAPYEEARAHYLALAAEVERIIADYAADEDPAELAARAARLKAGFFE